MNLKHTARLHHIGIAVRDLASAKQTWTTLLGQDPEGEETVNNEKVRICFYRAGQVRIELLEGTDPESAVSRFLEKNGPGIHHVAFAVNDLADAVKTLSDSGYTLIEPLIRTGAHGIKIAFVHPKSTGGLLVELCEQP